MSGNMSVSVEQMAVGSCCGSLSSPSDLSLIDTRLHILLVSLCPLLSFSMLREDYSILVGLNVSREIDFIYFYSAITPSFPHSHNKCAQRLKGGSR